MAAVRLLVVHYVFPSVIEIGIVIMILLIAATIEWNTITGIMGPHHHLP
jgi:hypothetical protein